jgi:tetratricopeptide (TPR) repeat protein
MNEQLRASYVNDVVKDIQAVSGARFEQWLLPLWDAVAKAPVNARGLNLEGAPVGYTLDAYWPDGSVSEASSNLDYFTKPFKKARGDFRHAIKLMPAAKIVRLFSSRAAGPDAATAGVRKMLKSRRFKYELDLWDAKRIAEYIVDKLLIDDRYVTRVGDTLPNLRRIAEQNAASNRIPALAAIYGGRAEDQALVERLMESNKVVVIAGLGGVGKSEMACAIAHNKRSDYEMVIWVDGLNVLNVNDLKAHDVRLNGYRLNIVGMLKSNKTLLIIDNARTDLSVDQLNDACGTGSNVLITSQVSYGAKSVLLGFVSDEHARKILSNGMPEECPEHLLKKVLESVEGHPLVLRMLNQHCIQHGGWSKIVSACGNIVAAPDERRHTVADRILSQHLDVLGPELALFKWCESSAIDASFFESVFPVFGVEKLERWSLLAKGQSDAVRLHDLVFASVRRVGPRIEVEENVLIANFHDFLVENLTPKKLDFFRAVHRHKKLVERVLRADNRPGAYRYAYIHSTLPKNLDPALLGVPDVDALKSCIGPQRPWMLSLVEAIEADYRRIRENKNKAAAKSSLLPRIAVFDSLMGNMAFDSDTLAIARHHKAKSLVKLGKVADALEIFESLVREYPTLFAARLQVARLLENEPERARDLVFEIIEAEISSPGAVSSSVLIETLSLLRRAHLRKFVPAMTQRYGQFMASQLKAAACYGEDQPIRAFAAIGPDWAYNSPELFLEVIEVIEAGAPEEADDDEERVAVGRILCAHGKMLLRTRDILGAKLRFENAVNFFRLSKKPPTPFACTHHADVLVQLRFFDAAAEVLDAVDKGERDVFWHLRRSEAHLGLNELSDALRCVDDGLAGPPDNDYLSTFLAVRSDILRTMGDKSSVDTLRAAIDYCTNDKFRGELEGRLALYATGFV